MGKYHCVHRKEIVMKKVSLIIALILITGLMFGCTKTTPTATPVSTETTPGATETTGSTASPAAGDKAAAEAYVTAWIEVQKDLDQFNKDWTELIASAEKLQKAELTTKLEEQIKKHDELKAKVDALKDKAATEDTKKHQEAVIEVLTLQVESLKANQDKYIKEGVDKAALETAIKEKDEAAKTKLEEAAKVLEDIKTKNEIKSEGGTTGGDTSTATPADTGTPAASPTETK